ncbi:aminotransferase class V [Pyrolobus fumarii 1A]|uniref:Aminotransferase class V n=2 Tax=Pyrolobus fumarii TaxID=54252 RepID=G0EHI5_PYRF1|nr:aminotransferase class V [Pyrolobus fumarii 1A]
MVLLTPGPVEIHERVLKALSEGIASHRSETYRNWHCEAVERLKRISGLRDGSVYLIPGSGTTAVDAMIYSVLAPGEKVLAYIVGEFGRRAVNTMKARGLNVRLLEEPWGKAIRIERLKEALEEDSYDAVFIVHNETSTGVANRTLREAAELVHKHGAILLVDSVSGFAGERLYMDDWGVDVVATATQKCLAAPPGLGIVMVKSDVVERIEKVSKESPPPPSINLSLYEKFLAKCETPFTPPVNVVRALVEALRLIEEEGGIEARYREQEMRASRFYSVIDAAGLDTLAEKSARSYTVAAVRLPEGVRAPEVKKRMAELGFEIAGGMGEYREKVVRVGLMGAINADIVEAAARSLVEIIQELSRG